MTIHKQIRVERPADVAFRLFCEEIGRWWPKGTSLADKVLTDLVLEGRVGGRFYEVHDDGTEFEIGRVTAYEPPRVVAFTWRAPSWDAPTQVEIRFIAEGAATLVELEHSGWDATPKARPFRKNYDAGWDKMLGLYTRHANPAA
jgi:uncharacterized protein YndB with AHSA1/START domain